jgi:hypothetical protein
VATIRQYTKDLKQLTNRELSALINDNWDDGRDLSLDLEALENLDQPKVVAKLDRQYRILVLMKRKLDAEVQRRPDHEYFRPGLYPNAIFSRKLLVERGFNADDIPF